MTEAGSSIRKVGSVAVIAASGPLHGAHADAMLQSLDSALDTLTGLAGIRAAVLIRENGNHISGAHIGECCIDEQQCRRLCARIEQLPMPVVAALHGTVQGIDLGVALACHYRVATPTTRCVAPELAIGLIPDAGCTQRLPRLIGVANTLELVLGGKAVDARTAVEWGLLDATITGDLQQGALIFAEQLIVDGKGPRRICDLQVNPDSGSNAVLDRFSRYAEQHFPNRIVPFTAIKAIRSSMYLPFMQGMELETELLAQARQSAECKGALHALAAERATRDIPGLPVAQAQPVKKVGIVGVGAMGAGIAICCANSGAPVTAIDVDGSALERGLAAVDRAYESMVRRGRLTAAEKNNRLSLITGSLDYADLQDADVIIESVFEDLELKRQIFDRLGEVARRGSVLASNTSTLDINLLGAMTPRPEEVIGMHFFSPANVMPLLEVVRTDATSAATIRTVMEFARMLRKTPVLARVCYGFIGNRMMEGYAREAKRMVLEGAAPWVVDATLEQWGMAMGPLAVTDLTGIDVVIDVHAANAARLPADPTWFQADHALYAAGRLGQKNNMGYYRYDLHGRTRHNDPEILAILASHAAKLGVERREHSSREILERCLYPLINEGLRILEEGVALRASDIDVVWLDGFGFPRYRGGPMFHADIIGLPTLLGGIRRYQNRFGPMHWQPAALLVQLVENRQTLREWQQSAMVHETNF